MKFTKSMALSSTLENLVATDICSPLISGAPKEKVFFTKSEGVYLYDVDGNRYIDFCNGKGSVLLGHNSKAVNEAIIEYIRDNRNCPTGPGMLPLQVAERIINKVNPEYKSAFFRTGGYAVYAAVLAAKKATGKNILLSAGYHGSWDIWESKKELFTPNKSGMIDFYYILEKLDELLSAYSDDVCGVIISPDDSYFSRDYYKRFIEICRKHKVLIISDEVKVGFRYNNGSYLRGLGLEADIYTFAKCIANGYGLSCVCGKTHLMKQLEHLTYTDYYGAVPYVAALVTLEEFDNHDGHKKLRTLMDRILDLLKDKIKMLELPVEIHGNGNLFQFHFYSKEMEADFYRISLNHNIVFYQLDNQCPSFMFDEAVAEELLVIIDNVFLELKSKYNYLSGKSIPPQRIFETAFNQIDGCIENFDMKDKLTHLSDLVKKL